MRGATNSFETITARLERVKGGRDGDVVASCPCKDHGQQRGDRNPSLHVTHDGERTLLHCMSGCHVQDVMMALGLDWPDLFDNELPDRRQLVASWTYQRPDGVPYFTVERWQTPTGKQFIQRVPGHETPGYHGLKPCLFNLPAVLAQARSGGAVYVVEGEKSVSAAKKLGIVATTAPNGCKGWRDYYSSWLKGASEVIVITDNDDAGRQYAASVCASVRGKGIRCRVVGVGVDSPKADLYDHVLAGHGLDDLQPLNLNRLRPLGATMSSLLNTEFPEPRFAVPHLIAAGLTLFGGAPKMGKSYIALDIALGVACGGKALSSMECNSGDVLYLSLDNDSPRRLKSRALDLMGGDLDALAAAGEHIEVHCEWPTGLSALTACQEWVNEAANPLLIVVDTLVRAEPAFEGDGRGGGYQTSTEVLGRWARFAIESDICLLTVHHDRKGEADDWLNRFTGSRGITATAQTLLMIEAKRGENEGLLRVTGRDIETDDLAMRRSGRSWIVTDPILTPLHAVG